MSSETLSPSHGSTETSLNYPIRLQYAAQTQRVRLQYAARRLGVQYAAQIRRAIRRPLFLTYTDTVHGSLPDGVTLLHINRWRYKAELQGKCDSYTNDTIDDWISETGWVRSAGASA